MRFVLAAALASSMAMAAGQIDPRLGTPVPATPQNASSFVGAWTITTPTASLVLTVKVMNAALAGEVTSRAGTHHATLKMAGPSLLAGYDFDDENGVSSDAVLTLTPNDREKRIDAHVDFANGAERLTGTATKK